MMIVSMSNAGRRNTLPLDGCDSLLALTIQPENGTIRLSWYNYPQVSSWIIYRATLFSMADIQIAAVVDDTNTWLESPDYIAAHPKAFYQVAAVWEKGTPGNFLIIEDFERPFAVESYTEQDITPEQWQVYPDGAYNPYGLCLELYGNTWKRERIDSIRISAESIWRVAAKCNVRGECQAFGIADSANELWYALWGTEIRRSGAWCTTYQGWFPLNQWIEADLPVGQDWMARFGYYPAITDLLFANDNDASTGIVRFDDIRDVTQAVSLPPNARFQWRITGYPTPDTMQVTFCSMGCDPDGSLYRTFWSFGDGSASNALHPVHRYHAGQAFRVTLTASDSMGRTDWITQQVADTVAVAGRRMTALFTGDVMLARRYEWDNGPGIIPVNGANAIFQKMRPLIMSVDFAMCNLECPLTLSTEHHPTKLYYFKGRPEYAAALTYAGFDFCALANNHNFDYLSQGMVDTKNTLDTLGLLSTGAGENVDLACQPVFFSKNGLNVGILSFCNRDGSWDNEQPFLAAGPSKPGFAMWDRAHIERTIPAVRPSVDVLIIQVHSGEEYAVLPPALASLGFRSQDEQVQLPVLLPDTSDRALRRYAMDLGADLIINHHPHVIQGLEVYHGKLIAQSMGNFAFDQQLTETFHSMVITFDLSVDERAGDFLVHPIYIDRYIPGVARGELAGAILDYISDLSRPMNTCVVRNPGTEIAAVLLDSVGLFRTGTDYVDTLLLQDRNGFAFSAPFRMRGGGYVARVHAETADSIALRIGKNILWHGNIENEGATPWDLNSNYERYDTTTAFRGQRSIGLNRAGGGTNSVSTTYQYRSPYDRNAQHTMMGWIRGNNAREAQVQFEFYSGRTGNNLQAQQTIQNSFNGVFPWTQVWDSLAVPEYGYFYNVRVVLQAPAGGDEGRAWFDDLALIQWQNWDSQPLSPAFPNDLNYIQVRAPAGTRTAIVSYRREWIDVSDRIEPDDEGHHH